MKIKFEDVLILLGLLVILFGCKTPINQDFVWNARINEGTHPTRLEDRREGYHKGDFITATLHFNNTAAYIHRLPDGSISNDQKDWNKREGIKFDLNPHGRTVMVGWRFVPVQYNTLRSGTLIGRIEVNFYSHGATPDSNLDYDFIPSTNAHASKPALSVPLYYNQDAKVYIERDVHQHQGRVVTRIADNEHMIGAIEETLLFGHDLPESFRLLNPWFGGNLAAPHTIHFFTQYHIR